MKITRGPEPMIQLRNQGMVLGEDHEKMSKSRGNVTAPDDLVRRYGADAVRSYLLFFAKWDMGAPWSKTGIEGTFRWLKRVWALFTESTGSGKCPDETKKALRRKLHQTLRQVTHDYKNFEFNTIVSGLMELLNLMAEASEAGAIGSIEWTEAVDIYLCMLAPICPHIAEELWAQTGREYSVHNHPWPAVDEEATRELEIVIPVQINGKLRDRITVPVDATEVQIRSAALASEVVLKFMEGKSPKKVIVAQKKLVNIVM
jgi:leucyl-tRNA synthetase